MTDKLGPYHYRFVKSVSSSRNRIVAIDTEWAKNWRAQEKFIPFCLSVHSIYLPDNCDDIDRVDIDKMHMEAELYFRSKTDATQDYIDKAEKIFSSYIDDNTLFVGHQLTSDLYTFVQNSSHELETIQALIQAFKERKNLSLFPAIKVADTRYDIKGRIRGNGAEKLRNVSLRFNIFAVQRELDSMSLTRMYNMYTQDADDIKREKLMVMNWRHAFQTALIWLVDSLGKPLYNSRFHARFLVTNDIIFRMGRKEIDYLNSTEYQSTRTLHGIQEYVERYYPSKRIEDLLCEV